MILSSVVIILGEVLEFTILTSIFLALSFHLKIPRRWIIYGVTFGCLGATSYALSFDMVSQWFEGFGQEVINATIQTSIYICLLLFCSIIFINRKNTVAVKYLKWLMIASVSLALTREGSEIFLYLSGVLASEQFVMPVLTGSALGAGIGLSFGILIYYIFINTPSRKSLLVGYALFIFISAGMLSQGVRLLIQIDWLPAQKVVWDTSSWLDESSVVGRLSYTILGYEATPTLIEIQFYITAIAGVIIATALSSYYANKTTSGN